jgi:hypothetical protein
MSVYLCRGVRMYNEVDYVLGDVLIGMYRGDHSLAYTGRKGKTKKKEKETRKAKKSLGIHVSSWSGVSLIVYVLRV